MKMAVLVRVLERNRIRYVCVIRLAYRIELEQSNNDCTTLERLRIQ